MANYIRRALIIAGAALLAAPLAMSSPPIRKLHDGAANDAATTDFVGENAELHRQLGGLAQCDCSQTALVELNLAHKQVLSRVPMTFMGLLHRESDAIGNSLGLEYDSLSDYDSLRRALQGILMSASEALDCIKCGPCDHDESSDSSSSPEQPEPYAGGERIGGISHYECCCDVAYIKDIAIKQMRTLVKMALLNPGADEFVSVGLESLERATVDTIEMISRPYGCVPSNTTTTTSSTTTTSTTKPTTTTTTTTTKATTTTTTTTTSTTTPKPICPCYSRSDLELAYNETHLHGCTFKPQTRSYANYDTPLPDPGQYHQRAWSVCVGRDCLNEHYCVEPERDCDVSKAVRGYPLMCYSGEAALRWDGFIWYDDSVMVPGKDLGLPREQKRLNTREYNACFNTLVSFCFDKFFGPFDSEEVEEDEAVRAEELFSEEVFDVPYPGDDGRS